VFFGSGVSALLYQALWQRLLSLHAGMDLFSVTVVVAAFMAGLGLGNIVGGVLADRWSARGAVTAYGLAELLIAVFGVLSPSLLYQWYPTLSPHLTNTASMFAFHFALLCLPTFLMGGTLPLLSRALVQRSAIAADVGTLYGLNTMGAATGALVTAGPWVLAHTGLSPLVYGAAGINALAGVAALLIAPHVSGSEVLKQADPSSERATRPIESPKEERRIGWLVTYGVTGFIALGLEVVWFRLLNVVMSSNTYTFSRLLTMYLVGLGTGSVLGARLLRVVTSPERTFRWLQWAIGVSALSGPVLVTWGIHAFGYPQTLAIRNLWIPVLTLLAPTILMGLSFVVIQAVVSQRFERVGRSTGSLLFANTLGCVGGTLVTSFVFLDRFGTSWTLSFFACASAGFGFWAAGLKPGRLVVVGVTTGLLVLALPQGDRFWQLLHGADGYDFSSREDQSCVTALVERERGTHTLYISGEIQNGVPFDRFHIRLGVLPPLFHSQPKKALVIGFGAGSTPFGIAADPRVEQVKTVEICGSEYPLVQALEQRGFDQVRTLFADPKIQFLSSDGRKYLVDTEERFDVIVTDTLLQRSSHSGSLYSVEFYELVKRRLAPNGILAQWGPTERTVRSAAQVFPHVAWVGGPQVATKESFFIATAEPVVVDTQTLWSRLQAVRREGISEAQWADLELFVKGFVTEPATRGDDVNTDLFPKDEYGHW
jgi:predicted membrane-bound spermidine synthase